MRLVSVEPLIYFLRIDLEQQCTIFDYVMTVIELVAGYITVSGVTQYFSTTIRKWTLLLKLCLHNMSKGPLIF